MIIFARLRKYIINGTISLRGVVEIYAYSWILSFMKNLCKIKKLIFKNDQLIGLVQFTNTFGYVYTY